jgi:plasminogen activator inhibitor 1 RNA-binding protein
MIIGERKERPDWRGKTSHYKGKPRQFGDHPFDRKSGTGRGRELAKGGHGKGNWGDVRDEIQGQVDAAGIEKPAAEKTAEEGAEPTEKPEGTPAEEVYTSPVKEEEEEEESKELTLEEYMAQKKKSTLRKEARAPEQLKKENIEKVDAEKQKVETISSNLRNQETYSIATGKNENAVLLGFQGEEDEYPRERGFRGGRGGRGGARGSRGGARGGEPRQGGRGGRQQQLNVNEEAFPAL